MPGNILHGHRIQPVSYTHLDVYKRQDLGITGIWYVGTMAFGCALFALLFSGLVKKVGDKLKNITFPELIEARYDGRSRTVATISTILAYIAYTAGQLAAIGAILHTLLGWDPLHCFILGAVVVILYTTLGGLLAVTYTCLLYTSRCV